MGRSNVAPIRRLSFGNSLADYSEHVNALVQMLSSHDVNERHPPIKAVTECPGALEVSGD